MKTSCFSCCPRSLVVLATLAAALPGLRADGAGATASAREIVLFPFDNVSLPFNKGLILTLMPGRKSSNTDPQHPNKPVLTIGNPGDADFPRAYFYGTVLKIGDEYRMWYTGFDQDRKRQVLYATSTDGVQWVKPKLGIADYRGNRDNNLVALDGNNTMVGMCALVLHDPEDPDPARRFKMLREDATPGLAWPVMAAVSADGINWKSLNGNKPINPNHQLEPSGVIKFAGLYYVNGHSGVVRHPVPGAHKRTMQTFASPDFATWTQSAHLSFRRDNLPPRPPSDFEGHRGEQVHVGASLWNRGNVVLGFYGQYHNETNDRRTAVVDIGLIVSNDAVHFREPIPDFKLIPSFEEPDRAEPRLTQGQGFLNIGDRTLVYYGIWTEVNRDGPTGVRIATWPRDRFGFYSPAPGITGANCISNAIALPRAGAKVFLNASDLSGLSTLKVEILDEQMRPIPGYSGDDCVLVNQPGFRQEVTWRGQADLGSLNQPVRVRVTWGGRLFQKAKLHAIYVE